MADVLVRNEGSIFLLTPMTEAASEWFADHLPEDAQTFGPATVVEHRYVAAIVEGMVNDGLVVQ